MPRMTAQMEQDTLEICRQNRVADILKQATIEEIEIELRRRVDISRKTLKLAGKTLEDAEGLLGVSK